MKHQSGNGSGKFNVHQTDMGGWVRVFPDKQASPPDDLPVYLSQTLTEWFRVGPQFQMRCVLPVGSGGDTVELPAWYEVLVLPPLQRPAPTKAGRGGFS